MTALPLRAPAHRTGSGPTTPRPVPSPSPNLSGGPGAAEEPVWLTGGRWPIAAWVHRPEGEPAGAVALCPPLMTERAAGYPLLRTTAQALAAAGLAVVRFDYPGTGDSAGPDAGPGRVGTWLDAVDLALGAAGAAGCTPLGLLGVRSGALLAAAAAARRGDVDTLVLWDPWGSGRRFVRRLRALQAMAFPGIAGAGPAEVPGFVLDDAVADELGALVLPASLPVRRALVVTRPGERLAAPRLGPAGGGGPCAVETAETAEAAPGEQEALFDVEPLARRLPTRTAETVSRWVAGAMASAPPPSSPAPGPAGLAGRPPAPPSGLPAGRRPGAAHEAVVAGPSLDGTTVVERTLRLGPRRLVGVEARPVRDGAGVETWPTVVFLSSGSDPHVGPSRLWVSLSRAWALLGVRCVRVDLSGWGDSDPWPGRRPLVLRPEEAFDDVADVLEALGGAAQAVLVGLCSGAYQALDSALEVAPLAVLAVNPLLRFTPPELAAEGRVSPRRRLCEPRRPWVGGLRAHLPSAVIDAVVGARHRLRRVREAAAGGSWLDALGASGVRVYCICGEREAEALPAVGPATAAGAPVRVDVIAGLDHALLLAAHRAEVTARLTDEVRAIVRGGPRQGRS